MMQDLVQILNNMLINLLIGKAKHKFFAIENEKLLVLHIKSILIVSKKEIFSEMKYASLCDDDDIHF